MLYFRPFLPCEAYKTNVILDSLPLSVCDGGFVDKQLRSWQADSGKRTVITEPSLIARPRKTVSIASSRKNVCIIDEFSHLMHANKEKVELYGDSIAILRTLDVYVHMFVCVDAHQISLLASKVFQEMIQHTNMIRKRGWNYIQCWKIQWSVYTWWVFNHWNSKIH